MRIDQISFYAPTEDDADRIKMRFGVTDWVRDIVTAEVYVWPGYEGVNVAELQFGYGLGIELELIRYKSGPNWIAYHGLNAGMITHVGLHLDDGEDFPLLHGCRLVQEAHTIHHTGERFSNPTSPMFGRRYHYKIFEFAPSTFIKYIRRQHNADSK